MIQFINDVVKPWDELNRLLARPFAYQPEVSDVTRFANALAVAIKHTAEHVEVGRRATDKASIGNRLMSDVADGWKHGGTKLDEPARYNSIRVVSRFEFNDACQMRFLRNRIVIEHAAIGTTDFMASARESIRYWLSLMELQINWSGALLEGPNVFGPHAVLYYDERQQLGMDSTQFETVKRAPDDSVYLADCPNISFVLLDFHDDSFSQLGPPIAGAD
jgi:hypothetical protein